VWASDVDAQGGQPRERCPVITLENSDSGLFQQLPGRGTVSFASGNVVFVCSAAGIRLSADSAEYHQASQIVYLFRNVRYTERGTRVDAQRMTYWKNEERLLAEGNVTANLDNGTTMRGPRVEYFRAVAPIRTRSRLHATGRPRITLVEIDTIRAADPPRSGVARGPRADTTHVDANTVIMDGDSLVYASGRVIVTRPDVIATSDSLALDRARETVRFVRTPVINGTGDRPFTLTGTVIDLYSRDRRLERVVSSGTARVVSEDLRITADTIDLRITEQLLQRAFAWGKSRANAVSPTQDLTADSLDMIMPQQRLTEVRAIGRAEAKTTPDSTKIRAADRDLLRGDTVHALFDSLPPGDTTSRARLRELRARGRAVAFYHIAPADTLSRCPNINYSTGDEIVVRFDSGEVRDVVVAKQDSLPARGAYLECAAPAAAGAARPPAGSAPGAPPPGPPPPPVGGDLRRPREAHDR
jgi:lipopolysaccharide export system protein LptA